MDSTEAYTDFELHGFRFLLYAALGARDHSSVILCFFAGAIIKFIAVPAAASLGKLSLPPDRGSYCYPGNTHDDLTTLVLHSPIPVFGKLFFCFGIIGNFLLHDRIGYFFFFTPSQFAKSGNGWWMPIDPKVSQSSYAWPVIRLEPYDCFWLRFVFGDVPDDSLERSEFFVQGRFRFRNSSFLAPFFPLAFLVFPFLFPARLVAARFF